MPNYCFVGVMCTLSEQMIEEIKEGTTGIVILNGKGAFYPPSEYVTKSGDIWLSQWESKLLGRW